MTEAGGPHLQHPARLAGLSHGAKARVEEEEVLTRSLVLILTAFPDLPLQSFSFLFYVSPTLNPNTLSYCYTHKYTRTFQVKGMGA